MGIVGSWKRCFSMLFSPHEIGLFLTETLSRMRHVINTLYAPWFLTPIILVLVGAALIGFFTQNDHQYMSSLGLVVVVSNFTVVLSSVFFLIAARSIHEVKSFEYFKHALMHVLMLAITSTILSIIIWLFSMFWIINIIVGFALFIFSITPYLVDTIMLYSLDGYQYARKQAFMTIWYYYPLYAACIIGVFIAGKTVGYVMHFILELLKNAIPPIFILIIVGIFSLVCNLFFTLFTKCATVSLYNRHEEI